MKLTREILKAFPSWSLEDLLNTDVKYLDDIIFASEKSKQPQVMDMEQWILETGGVNV
ncbi:hypothetical protein [Enterococcus cecorum]|uniref:hypothetical protein n=1 Tax=Enterococcus cecorum TaxID=44008 RepID=UPI000378019E|nr:hypothetical protein [Enterococcus cecorum]MDY2954995.1 hypothetical protein [Enterococcus cecorum]MDZ5578586.1 hypothetical protein [Enterococcus cecorum]MDZ5583112.1 hypothetical protein [Enterococcus cecorum]OJG33615.1 hypothetical protein RT42_GL001885 [Enterococcus cecorum DSM 20682 = ATCC 43198]